MDAQHEQSTTNVPLHGVEISDFTRRVRARQALDDKRKATVLERLGGIIAGAELERDDGRAWAVITPNTYSDSAWRVTRYDEHGFLGHWSCDSAETAFDLAWTSGFRAVATRRLDDLVALPTFSAE